MGRRQPQQEMPLYNHIRDSPMSPLHTQQLPMESQHQILPECFTTPILQEGTGSIPISPALRFT